MVYKIIEVRRKSGKDTGDLMSMLLHAKDESGAEMTDKQLRDEVLICLPPVTRRQLNALTWTFYLLSENPSVEAKFHEEVDALNVSNGLTASDVPRA